MMGHECQSELSVGNEDKQSQRTQSPESRTQTRTRTAADKSYCELYESDESCYNAAISPGGEGLMEWRRVQA